MYVCIYINVTVNIEIFAQYIFSRISRRALDARKFDVSENYNHNTTINSICAKIKLREYVS